MNDPPTPARQNSGAEPTLDNARAMFPHWECWKGISGLLYARQLLSSPPVVIRAESVQDLIDQIRGHLGRQS